MAQVTIGKEFFKKSKKDYCNWHSAWIREMLQNCADSGGKEIFFNFEKIDELTIKATVTDDGCGMDTDVLVNKLFSLGSSGKDFKEGAVGGFGKAKELLYFSQHRFEIETNELFVSGEGGEYTIYPLEVKRKGTQSTVWLDVDNWRNDIQRWIDETVKLVEMSGFTGRCVVNNYSVFGRSNCGESVREFNCGSLFRNLNSAVVDRVIYRVAGSPMFYREVPKLGYSLILELKAPSVKYLASNRDNVVYEAQSEIDPFISELTIDKRTALKRKNAQVIHYAGKRGRLRMKMRQKKLDFTPQPPMNDITVEQKVRALRENELVAAFTKYVNRTEIKPKIDFQAALAEYDFMIYHNKSEPLPDKWKLGTFCENAEWVAWGWSAAVWEVFVAYGKEPDFGFGFVFDDDALAQYGKGFFLINPCHTDYKIKYTRTRKSACELLINAAHEFVHYLGHNYHDEDYALCFSALMEKVLFSSPHAVSKILSKTDQASLNYEDLKSMTAFNGGG